MLIAVSSFGDCLRRVLLTAQAEALFKPWMWPADSILFFEPCQALRWKSSAYEQAISDRCIKTGCDDGLRPSLSPFSRLLSLVG